jgi:hypothetical protein
MADATIAARFGTNPLATWTGAEKIPADNGAGVGVVGLASTLKAYMSLPPLVLASGSIVADNPALSITQTWNNVAITFSAFKVNVTDTNSAGFSLLANFQVAGVSKVTISKEGVVAGASLAINTMSAPGVWNKIFGAGAEWMGFQTYNALVFGVNGQLTTFLLSGDMRFSWNDSSGGGAFPSNIDLTLVRDAAGILAQRNGVNAQTLRVYNTYTDASNYERGVFDWQTSANVLTIGAQALGTGTLRTVNIVGSQLLTNTGLYSFIGSPTYGWGFDGATALFAKASGNRMMVVYGGGVQTAANTSFSWSATANDANATAADTALNRNAAGVVEVNNGTAAAYRDIKARNFISNDTVFLIRTSAALATGGAAATATMTNAPVAGNPTKWISIDDNGTTRKIPAW